MPQLLLISQLACALLLPVVGAIGLRLFGPRLQPRVGYAIAAVIFILVAASTITLANSNRTTLRIAGLTLLLSDSGPAEPPIELLPEPIPFEEPADPTGLPQTTPDPDQESPTATAIPTNTPPPTNTAAPTNTPPPTSTPEPTATPVPPTATPVPPTETPVPSGPRRYTIQPGDTLRDIAERFGVSVQAILRANNLTPAEADSLRPGQEIIIP
jgi:LysM repeat protein